MTNSEEPLEANDPQPCIVSHLYAADCPNLVGAMKAIVTGFVERLVDDEDDAANEHPHIRCTLYQFPLCSHATKWHLSGRSDAHTTQSDHLSCDVRPQSAQSVV